MANGLLNNTLTKSIGAGVGGTLIGGGIGYMVGSASARKKRRKNRSSRKRSVTHRKRKQKQPYTAGKRKDTSHKRIRYTKNNQPYIILASGKARFISKRSASSSKKRKGGRY